MKTYALIGTVSEGTHRPEDLIPAFVTELRHAMRSYEWQGMTDQARAFKDYNILIHEAERALARKDDLALEFQQEAIAALFDALNDFAPPYCHFGAHEGDGADFGFWPDVDSAMEDAEESGYRLEISDHGNVSLYDADGREVWAVV